MLELGGEAPENFYENWSLGTNLTINEDNNIKSQGAKPPKIYEISSKFASKNESDNKGQYMLLGGEAPENFTYMIR